MTTRYQVLFSVVMQHPYFADGQLRDLVATPTPATADCLRRAGLLLKRQPAGFVVLYASSSVASTPPAALRSVFPLVFQLTPQDPYFLNYSDLPLASDTEYPYCLGTQKSTQTRNLQAESVVSATDQRRLRPLLFQVPASKSTDKLTISRHDTGEVIAPLPGLPNAAKLTFDLRRWGSGYYQLKMPGRVPEIFYADEYLAGARPWGLLAIDDIVLKASAAPTYLLSFGTRLTLWQYNVVSRQPTLPEGLAVETGTTLVFTKLDKTPAGVAASFRAVAAQPLAQRYPAGSGYQLVVPAAVGSTAPKKIICPILPQASPEGLEVKNNGTEKLLITNLFVHL